jgi:hypothetical protein
VDCNVDDAASWMHLLRGALASGVCGARGHVVRSWHWGVMFGTRTAMLRATFPPVGAKITVSAEGRISEVPPQAPGGS